ncbi:hypothetical protein [Ammoniphilus sp. CFH 90114]|uniref:hypothetical protein n=1 Tax=Ammoniphilus sp. CFH 90114 TaxID=2493665 RepID=UPI0013E9683B|nr:hypothetical protein [Ammoniphilus sp. CFH 90114]
MSVFTGMRKMMRKTGSVEDKRLTSREKSALAAFTGTIIAMTLVTIITIVIGT